MSWICWRWDIWLRDKAGFTFEFLCTHSRACWILQLTKKHLEYMHVCEEDWHRCKNSASIIHRDTCIRPLLAEISSQSGISFSHWLIWLPVEEPLTYTVHSHHTLKRNRQQTCWPRSWVREEPCRTLTEWKRYWNCCCWRRDGARWLTAGTLGELAWAGSRRGKQIL